MHFESTFPFRIYLNLGRADERRQTVEAHFYECGLEVRRQPAVQAGWLRSARGYPNTSRRAKALGKRLAIRRAHTAGAEALFLFEDDVVLHPDWRCRVEALELPADWGIFMLGALHIKPPVPCAPGLVRCTFAVDNHAIGFRADYFTALRRTLRGRAVEANPDPNRASDVRIAECQPHIPTYAAWPNLAWQRGADSFANYAPDGRQRIFPDGVAGVDEAMRALCIAQPGGAGVHRSDFSERPWMHQQEVALITGKLHSGMSMLEYGSGGSTAAFAPLVSRYCSIEHNAAWFAKVEPQALANGVQLLLRQPAWDQRNAFDAALPGQFTDYIEAWRECAPPFDAVLIDGRARVDAALSVAEGVRPGGWLFFHDYFSRERYWRRQPALERFYELVESAKDTQQTLAVFRRR